MILHLISHAIEAAGNLNCNPFSGDFTMCQSEQFVLNTNDAVHGAIQSGSNDVLNAVGQAFLTSWEQFQLSFLTSWLNAPTLVDLNAPNGTTKWLIDLLSYFAFIATTIGILVNSVNLFIAFRGDKARQLGVSLARLLVVTNAAPLIVSTLELLSHQISTWLLQQAQITSWAAAVDATTFVAMPGVYLIAALLGIIGVFVQWGIMLVRGSLLPLFTGLLPLSAAIATVGGKATQTYEKITAWLLAFVIYPIPAAIIYVVAFRLKSGYDGIGGAIAGMILEVLALFALPALFRIISPHTAALGKAYGGAIALKTAITVAEAAATIGAAVVTAGAVMAGGKTAAAGKTASTATQAGTKTGAQATTAGTPGPQPTGAETADAAPATAGSGSTPGTNAGSGPAHRASAPTPANPGTATGTRTGARQESASRRDDGQLQRIYARQQAANTAAAAASRTARDSIEDLDETIGGKA